jgi:hypothetical protein
MRREPVNTGFGTIRGRDNAPDPSISRTLGVLLFLGLLLFAGVAASPLMVFALPLLAVTESAANDITFPNGFIWPPLGFSVPVCHASGEACAYIPVLADAAIRFR